MTKLIDASRAILVALCLSLTAPPIVAAHDMEKGPNGGQVIESKGHHVELAVSGRDIKVWLSDAAHAPIASKGASGRAVILASGRQSTLELAPAEPNLLTATTDAPLGAGARIVISTKLGSGQELQGRFVLK